MVLGGVAFGKCFGHEGGALLNRISALIKETPQGSLASSAQAMNKEESPHWNETMLVP